MLTDNFLRKHDYLRVSITDKCNLRCIYCMPPEGVPFLPHGEVLRNEEFVELIRVFIEMGVKKIRFTGGEPLVRKGFVQIIEEVHSRFPDVELALTTNGVLLGEYLEDLQRNGVYKLNVSLDTMDRQRYQELTLRDHFDKVVENIDMALETGAFDVKLNAVLLRETLGEVDAFLDFCSERNLILRFIEKMPFTEEELRDTVVSSDSLVKEFESRGNLIRRKERDSQVAHRYDLQYKDDRLVRLGVIPPMTHKFCSSCNRLRLTADGNLKTCLHSCDEYDLKGALRDHASDEELKKIIHEAVEKKHEGHKLDCYATDGGCASIVNSRTMSKIGG